MLQSFPISYDSYGGRGACLYANHYCFIGQETVTVSSELLESFAESFSNCLLYTSDAADD